VEDVIDNDQNKLDLLKIRIADLESANSRLEAENASLRDSEEKYRLLIENANDGIVVSQSGKIQLFNRRFINFSGTTPEEAKEMPPMPILEYVHPDDREMVMLHHIRRMRGEEKPKPYILRVVDPSGKTWWVENRGVMISWNGAPATLNFLRDVTKRIEAEDQIRLLTRQLLQAHEDERLKISLDLHDSVVQDLSYLRLKIDSMSKSINNIDHPDAKLMSDDHVRLANHLSKLINDLRALVYGLYPMSLREFGLVRTIKHYCHDFTATHKIKVDFDSTGMDELPLGLEKDINIYRIVQEALNNIVKHAEADTVVIRIIASHPNIILRIQDNGKGFEKTRILNSVMSRKQMGIRSITERAKSFGGTAQIDSRPGHGTKLAIVLPGNQQVES
jgi:PAS domain S-box-containing protein